MKKEENWSYQRFIVGDNPDIHLIDGLVDLVYDFFKKQKGKKKQ